MKGKPGRPKLPTREAKSHTIIARFTFAEKYRIRAAAKRVKLPLSQIVREVLLAWADMDI